MKNLVFLITLLLVLTSCEDMTGLLKVTEKFNAITSNGRTREIPEGQHETKLDFERDSITANINFDGREIKIVINLRNVSLPENGPFELKSGQTGQPFDIKGSVQTEITRSDLKTEKETCTYTAQEPVCDQNGCTIRNVTKTGWRDIEYFEETTNKQLQFETYNRSNRSQSLFEGHSNTMVKRFTFQGQCF